MWLRAQRLSRWTSKSRSVKKLSVVFALWAAALPIGAATTTTWEINGFSDFLKGRLSGLSLTADGRLAPGPATDYQVQANQPAVWSLAAGPNGSVYAGTGHQGIVFRIDPAGKRSEVWSAPEPEVFALAVAPNGDLYVGSSPNGAVYRVRGGKGSEFWRGGTKYIWSLVIGPDGSIYAGTGDAGKIYRIHPNGAAEVYYETGQMNVTSLAMGADGHLLAGTDPNGLIYDISGPGKATVLYDSNLPEIRALGVEADGTIYAAGMGGAVSTRNGTLPPSSQTATTAAVAASPTVITVSEAAGNVVDQTTATTPSSQTASGTSTSASSAGASAAAVTEVSGVEKAAIYKIGPDRVVETVWTSKDDNIYDLIADGDSILFSTDVSGSIYRLRGHETTLLAELADGETTRILKAGDVLFAGMSNPGRVFVLGSAGTKPARYESAVHDAGSVARWGHLHWHGAGEGVTFRTRTGYAARPDGTWSEWSSPMNDLAGAAIQSPPARFIQWMAEWPAGSAEQLDTVDVPFLPQNRAPEVHSLTVTSVLNQNALKSAGAAANNTAAYTVTVTDTGQASASTATSGTQSVSRLQSTQTQISWQADDPDSDKLVYSVYFRSEDETSWQLVRSRMFENTLLLDPDVFADGRYYFRVVASDAPSNDQQFAKESELVSAQVLIDNTPPVVTIDSVKRNGDELDVDVTGADTTSPLRVCEYSVDAGPWQPIDAVEGVTDMQRQRFHLHLDKIRPGEHLLVFRIYDVANNAGLAKAIIH